MRDQYKPGRVLGKGSYGVVLNCVECSSGNAYACKSVAIAPLLATPDGQNVVARLRSELGVMGYLAGHPNICRLHDFYESPSHLFIIQVRMRCLMDIARGADGGETSTDIYTTFGHRPRDIVAYSLSTATCA